MISLDIESLDREGRGVAHHEGKAIFVDGAVTGERVACAIYKKKPSFELAQMHAIERQGVGRVDPLCRHFGTCGGCAMQHVEPRAQVATKQRVLEDCLSRIGKVTPEQMLSPIHGPAWGYRRRARLSVRLVRKKGGVLVGFHERRSSYVADMFSCEILPPAIAEELPRLRTLVEGLSICERLPQIEVAVGERATVLVLRVLETPSAQDESHLRAYAERTGFQLWFQPAGPDSAQPFWPLNYPDLSYELPEFSLDMRFMPTEFTQINHEINRVLVRRAMRLLDPRPEEFVGDLFCGLGNFSLPIARFGARVMGVEGSAGLVERATQNAARHGLDHLARFEVANLFDAERCTKLPRFDKLLIDPPREGAVEVVKSLQGREPRRIMYVSCDPATLARDAAILVHTLGYRLSSAGVVNMFPHTAHVESLAVFDRQ